MQQRLCVTCFTDAGPAQSCCQVKCEAFHDVTVCLGSTINSGSNSFAEVAVIGLVDAVVVATCCADIQHTPESMRNLNVN